MDPRSPASLAEFRRTKEGLFTERCPSWLKEHDWKSCVRPKGVPRVRIPLSPPSFYPLRPPYNAPIRMKQKGRRGGGRSPQHPHDSLLNPCPTWSWRVNG